MTTLFVYGTLKRGCCRADVLREQRFVGEARTVAGYRLFDTGDYPAMVEDDDGLAIKGELWEVDTECLALLDQIEGVPTLYERKAVAIAEPATEYAQQAQTYIYRQSVVGLADCGCRWDEPRTSPEISGRAGKPLFLVDLLGTGLRPGSVDVDVVCAGDSITGWNNFGPAAIWPYPTYPRFLQVLASPRGLRVADGGIAGEISGNGFAHVERYLDLFPGARYFIIGFGTNDLGLTDDFRLASRHILDNLEWMVRAVQERGKQPILLSVPYAKESMFPRAVARALHDSRDYHNRRLAEFCRTEAVPLADICPVLCDEHFGDHVHPNEDGARRIAAAVFKVLSAVLAGNA